MHLIKIYMYFIPNSIALCFLNHGIFWLLKDVDFPPAPPIPEFNGPPMKSNLQGPVPFLPKDTERFLI